ncbi:MAG TPA: ABC transporter permease [Gemmatimonadaceae bacterium]|nr:ABC transporter permease [Gemmatimonadaceae bacterium]
MTVRVYRALLVLLLPSSFHDAFGSELLAVYTEIDRAVRARAGRRAAWRALAAELPGLIRLAVNERRTDRTIRAPAATTRLEENMFDSLRQDLTVAARSLRRSPLFALVAIASLALGIGANTAIFSVVDAVLLAPLHFADPSRLVALNQVDKTADAMATSETSPASFYDWQAHTRSMHLAGYSGVTATLLRGGADPEQLEGLRSIGGLLPLLGVAPEIGRVLTLDDEVPEAPPVMVLSYDRWRRSFGGDRGVIGRVVDLNGMPTTIVGVMPPAFGFGDPLDYVVPAHFTPQFRANRDQYFISVVGRLAPGATVDAARAEMGVIGDRLIRDWPKFNQGTRIDVAPLRDTIVGAVRRQLFVLMCAVGFVLLITCANLGNLLLARAAGRRREIAIRQALGAGRSRVLRQLLTESMLLAGAGGVAGLLVGKGFLRLLLAAQVTTNLPRAGEIALDARVILFTTFVSIAAGLAFGSVPGWQLARGSSIDALRDGGRGSSGHQWARSVLVVSEIALAMILLTGAGLLLRSFERLREVHSGVRTEGVLTFSLRPHAASSAMFEDVLTRLHALPGVRAAAVTSYLPIAGRGTGAWFNRIDRPLPENVQPTGVPYRVVTPEFFAATGIPLVRGRLFTTADRVDAPGIIVNEALVKQYYPGEDPLGKPVYMGAPDNRLFHEAPIVGVVADTRDAGLAADPLPTVYIPLAVMPSWPFFDVVVRTTGNASLLAPSARAIVHAVMPTTPVGDMRTYDDVLAAAVAPARWSTTLLGVFAAVALAIAVLGVFGVLSFLVTQRTRELGIRIALGASSRAVRRMVVGRGLVLVGAGLGVGVLGALLLTQFMSTLLFDVPPRDAVTFVGVAALLAICGAVASYLPARRATLVDPVIALRAE